MASTTTTVQHSITTALESTTVTSTSAPVHTLGLPSISVPTVNPLITLAIECAVALILGFGGIFGLVLFFRGKVGRTLLFSRRRGNPLIFHFGSDILCKILAVRRGWSGVYHAEHLEVLTDKECVKPFQGLTPTVFATTEIAGGLSPKWTYQANRLNKSFLDREGKTPEHVADVIEDILKRSKRNLDVINIYEDVLHGKPIDTIVKNYMTAIGATQNDAATLAFVTDYVKRVAAAPEPYIEEYKNIESEKFIPITKDNLSLEWVRGIPRLITTSVLKYRDFEHYIDVGLSAPDVVTLVNAAKRATLKEQTGFKSGKTMKWLSLGVTIFLVMIGVYLVMSQVGK